jgi:hypothetical protein
MDSSCLFRTGCNCSWIKERKLSARVLIDREKAFSNKSAPFIERKSKVSGTDFRRGKNSEISGQSESIPTKEIRLITDGSGN